LGKILVGLHCTGRKIDQDGGSQEGDRNCMKGIRTRRQNATGSTRKKNNVQLLGGKKEVLKNLRPSAHVFGGRKLPS